MMAGVACNSGYFCLNFEPSIKDFKKNSSSPNNFLPVAWYFCIELIQSLIAVIDFVSYEPSNGMESLFIGAPIFNNTGTLQSIVVLQLGPSFVNTIIDSLEGMGATGESCLIRWFDTTEKFEFRSNMHTMGDGKYIIGYKMVNVPEYWKDAVNANFERGHGLYLDSATKEVLVAYDSMDIPGIEWYQISKIDKQEVIEPLRILLSKGLPVTFALCLFIVNCAQSQWCGYDDRLFG